MERKKCEDCIHICGADVFRSFTKRMSGPLLSGNRLIESL